MNDLKRWFETRRCNPDKHFLSRQASIWRICLAAGVSCAVTGIASASEGGVSGADVSPEPQLTIQLQALDSAPWNRLDADDRVALERALVERFGEETGLPSQAVWCATDAVCSSAAPLALRVELAKPYLGQLRRGFSLTLSGNPRSGDFGKVALLPMSCGRWDGAQASSTPGRVEQTVGAELLQPEPALDNELLAAQIYDACVSQLPQLDSETQGLVAAPVTANEGGIEKAGGDVPLEPDDLTQQTGQDAEGLPGGDSEPSLVYRNAESTVTLQFGNGGQNR